MIFRNISKKALLLFLGDLFFILVAYALALYVRGYKELIFDDVFLMQLTIIFMLNMFVFCLFDFYDFSVSFTNVIFLFNFLLGVLFGFMVISTTFYFLPFLNIGRGVLLVKTGFLLIFCYVWRMVFQKIFYKFVFKQKNIVIVGAGSSGKFIYNAIKNDPHIHVKAFVDDDVTKIGLKNSPVVVGGCEKLLDGGFLDDVKTVIIAIKGLKSEKLLKCVLYCKSKKIDVIDMPSFYELKFGKIPVKYVDDFWMVANPMQGLRKTIYNSKLKQMFDIFFALLGLILSLPITILVSLAILIDDGFPIIFKQRRVGNDGVIFISYKFRTMKNGMENKREKAGEHDDPRITRVGKYIRKIRIDEIPQMWNVLKKEMSFVGPRALIEEEVSLFEQKIPYFALRHTVKPGITGWAQVNYKHGATLEDGFEKLQYDLWYIKNLSPALDFYIMLKTIKVVLFGRGAR